MEIAHRIEQTWLQPDSIEDELCLRAMAAREHDLAALAVLPVWARFAVTALAFSSVRVDVPVGYPLGTHTASVKGLEARLALEEGALEVTIVPNLAAYKTGYRQTFRQDVAYVIKQCRLANPDSLAKVLIYVDLLSLAEQREVVRLVQESGGQFLVVGTYAPQPITPTMVRRLAEFIEPPGQIGVLGEVRSLEEARPLLELGIARLATPWGVEVVKEAAGR